MCIKYLRSANRSQESLRAILRLCWLYSQRAERGESRVAADAEVLLQAIWYTVDTWITWKHQTNPFNRPFSHKKMGIAINWITVFCMANSRPSHSKCFLPSRIIGVIGQSKVVLDRLWSRLFVVSLASRLPYKTWVKKESNGHTRDESVSQKTTNMEKRS